jgi:hypothetical protein
VIAYKLVRLRKDGSIGSLFINRRRRLRRGVWMEAEDHKTRGYAHRPGWHVLAERSAPHLSKKDRVWVEVEIRNWTEFERPESQGGLWYLAQEMKISLSRTT